MPVEKVQLKAGNRTVPVSNLDKVLYPADEFTKGQVIHYYLKAAPYLLPHLANRPVTLKRFPDGVSGVSFYEKNAPKFTPDWVRTIPAPRREGGPDIQYIAIQDAATLAWTASLAALELHPFLHRAPRLDQPTMVVFDLDPGEGVDVLACARVAFRLRDLLADLRLECFPKVSGSKGIQVYVPLNRTVRYAVTQPFAHAIAQMLERQYPDEVVASMSKRLRPGKVFIDWSQNSDHKTTIAVYSLRTKHERPFVSAPVTWSELTEAIERSSPERLYFSPDQTLARLKRSGDLFEPVLTLKQSLPRAFVTREALP
jgi:bifunctional non-homologous end joining protein LigD